MADSNLAANAPVEVDFSPKPSFQLLFDGMHVEQELGRPFLIHLELSSGKLQPKVPELIGSACCIWMFEADTPEDPNRYFHGIVTRVVSAGMVGGSYRYSAELRPWVWLLSQVTDCRIFQTKTAFQIVTQVFRDAGFSDFKDSRQGGSGDIELEYCVQYRETSLSFVTRLMEQYGFYYYFEHSESAHTLVFVDDPNAHPLVSGDIPFKFDETEYRTVGEHVWQWSFDHALNTGKWTYQDYNFTTPSADLTAKKVNPEENRYGKFEVYEYPGPYDTAATGNRLSDVRMQALVHERQVFGCHSNSRRLNAGARFKLSQHPEAGLNREYLVTRSKTVMGGAEGTPNPDADTVDTYRVELHGIPGDVHFRLPRHTPRPHIGGPQTAVVVGKPGEEITTDEYGRIKVKFHWDRSSTPDADRTCWIRVAQSWAGSGFGAMVIPRVGQEVVVEFLEGNPDRPLITGVVYNANNKVPSKLPDNKTQTSIKSSSSPGGGGSNEFRFEDKGGEEEVYLHAQYDFRREVKHDEISTVKNDRTVTVTSGNDSLTVSSGSHSVTVSAGSSEVKAAQSITLSVGSNSVKIDTTGVTINGQMISVQANTTMTVQGGTSLSLTAATIALN